MTERPPHRDDGLPCDCWACALDDDRPDELDEPTGNVGSDWEVS